MNEIIKKSKIDNLYALLIVTMLISMYLTITLVIGYSNYNSSEITSTVEISTPIFSRFNDLMSANLGKLLALIGFAGTFMVYMMTHKAAVLFFGIIISLIAGGMVGISSIFFEAGTASFKLN